MNEQARSSSSRRVAVIGLGSMGHGMAVSLKRAGHEVVGFDVRAEAVERFVADGGLGAATPGEAARGAAAVVSVVLNAEQTEAVLFGADGCAATMEEGADFISSATMAPSIATWSSASRPDSSSKMSWFTASTAFSTPLPP